MVWKSVRFRTCFTAVAIALSASATLAAGDEDGQDAGASKEQLQATEAELGHGREERAKLAEQREILANELRSLRQELVLAARDTQEREAIVARLEDQLRALEAEKLGRRQALIERQQSLSGTLGALMRLSRAPAAALLLRPDPPLDTVRSAVLMKAAIPALRDQAYLLNEELAALEAVELDIGAKLGTLTQAEDQLAAQRQRLEGLIVRKRDLLATTTTAYDSTQAEIEKLALKARSLREFLANLARVSARQATVPDDESAGANVVASLSQSLANLKPDGLRPFPVNGRIIAPVAGTIVSRYGDANGFGQTSKGIVIKPRAGARIVAPFDGQVVFAGAFQNLGNILIIEHAGGYHTVLSGFSRIDSVTGQWLLAGEPVGIAAGPATAGVEAGNRPGVYIELRRNGQPVNPLKWLSS